MNVKLLQLRSKMKQPFELQVSGTSMLPILQDGEIITVCRKEEYTVGDVLVFIYNPNELLVHRLLKIKDGRYFCKGDNSFRLEDITVDQIIGAVIINNDRNHTDEFVNDSFQISRIFRRCIFNIEKTKATTEYQIYYNKYFNHI